MTLKALVWGTVWQSVRWAAPRDVPRATNLFPVWSLLRQNKPFCSLTGQTPLSQPLHVQTHGSTSAVRPQSRAKSASCVRGSTGCAGFCTPDGVMKLEVPRLSCSARHSDPKKSFSVLLPSVWQQVKRLQSEGKLRITPAIEVVSRQMIVTRDAFMCAFISACFISARPYVCALII